MKSKKIYKDYELKINVYTKQGNRFEIGIFLMTKSKIGEFRIMNFGIGIMFLRWVISISIEQEIK